MKVREIIGCILYDENSRKILNDFILPNKNVSHCNCCKKITDISLTVIKKTEICENCHYIVCTKCHRGCFYTTDDSYRSDTTWLCSCCITKNIEEIDDVTWTFIDHDDGDNCDE